MNEEPPTPFDTVGDAPVEARIVAWVLGEASAFEAAELERLCEVRPELLIFHRRMLALHGLLAEAETSAADPAWKLSSAKRGALDEILGPEIIIPLDSQKELRVRRAGKRAFFAIAACLVLAVVVLQLVRPIWVIQTTRAPEKKVDFMPEGAAYGDKGMVEKSKSSGLRSGDESTIFKRVTALEDGKSREIAAAATRRPGTYKVDSAAVATSREPGLQQAARQSQLAKQAPRTKSGEGEAADAFAAADAAQVAIPESEAMPSVALNGSMSGLGSGKGIGTDLPAATAKPSAPAAVAPTASPSRAGGGAFRGDVAMAGKKTVGERFEARIADSLDEKSAEAEAGEKLKLEGVGRLTLNDKDTRDAKNDAPVGGVASEDGYKSEYLYRGRDLAAKEEPKVGADVTVSGRGGATAETAAPIRSNPALTNQNTQNVDKVRRALYSAEGNLNLGKYDDSKKDYEEVLRNDPYNTAARRGLERIAAVKSDYYRAAYDQSRAELSAEVDKAWELTVPTVPTDGAEGNDQFAGKIGKLETKKNKPALLELIEEITAAEDPYSTFSLNISDASFQMAKASLAKGERPDPASIKPEQFYNAVDYGDPAPTSNEPVAATIEQSAHPFIPGRNLVRVALRTGSVGRSAAQPLRLTLLVDQSGSMVREDRRASMEHALAQLGVLLTKNDLVTVVGFSRTPHLLADGMTGDQATKLGALVNQTASEGGTNLEEALKLGRQMAERHQLAGAQNRIVLFTDGAANLGDADPARLAEQVKALRQKGISFDIAGIGADGLNDKLLGEMARNGNGRYYVVGSEKNDSFARQLAGAFRPAAENVKVQVIFNPLRVGKYQLIGFEKDRLKTEDFRNDAVDAAELAAEEAGVAIYQVEPLAGGSGELGEVSVRFRDAAGGQMVERSWTIPHDARATAFDRATPSMQLAGLSLFAAEKLKGGPLAEAIDFQQLAGSSAFVKQFYGNSPRVSDMLRVIDALK